MNKNHEQKLRESGNNIDTGGNTLVGYAAEQKLWESGNNNVYVTNWTVKNCYIINDDCYKYTSFVNNKFVNNKNDNNR